MHSIPCPHTRDSSSPGSPRSMDPGAMSGGARGATRPACCERGRFVRRASHIGLSAPCLALLLWFLGTHAHSVAQTFQLRAGWNSIWLEVEPTNAATTNVLAGAPFASVWTFYVRFDFSMEDGSGGNGFSFNFAPPPPSLPGTTADTGLGNGLSVNFQSDVNAPFGKCGRAEVKWKGQSL